MSKSLLERSLDAMKRGVKPDYSLELRQEIEDFLSDDEDNFEERALEAEALARELKKSLKFFLDRISNGDLVEPEPSQWMSLELSLIAALYHKAKEVLGKCTSDMPE